MSRGGILAGSAVAALIAAGLFVIAGEQAASAQAKKEVPLETKEDASARPWKRYAGWPTRDYSKFNTLGNLASPPAPKAAAQDLWSDYRRRQERRRDGGRPQSRRFMPCLSRDGAGRRRQFARQRGSRPFGNRQCRPRGRMAVQLHLRWACLQPGHRDAALGQPRLFQRSGNQRHGCVPEDTQITRRFQDRAR